MRSLLLSLLLFTSVATSMAQPQVLTEKQLGNQRVWNARLSSDETLRQAFTKQQLQYPPKFVYWRVFKKEKQMELWAADSTHHRYKLVKTYAIVNMSGTLGPKRMEGSNFYLSYKVSYPNKSDSILGNKSSYGGQIFVHGDSLTIGCLPMSDDVIKELYWCNVQAQNNKDTNYFIPIHIYPCRMNAGNWAYLKSYFNFDNKRLEFWRNLQDGFNYFEVMRTPPKMTVDNSGKYQVKY